MSGSGPCWPHCEWNCERTQGFLSKSGSGVLWWLLLQCIPHVPPGYFVIPSVATFWKQSQCIPWGKVWMNWGAFSKSNQHVPPGESVNKLIKNHNVISVYPLVNWPLSPSGYARSILLNATKNGRELSLRCSIFVLSSSEHSATTHSQKGSHNQSHQSTRWCW